MRRRIHNGDHIIWTKKRPLKQGWYWMRRDRRNCASMVFVVKYGRGSFRIYISPEERAKWTVDDVNYWWAGPIQLPAEK